MRLKFRNQVALETVTSGLVEEGIPYSVDYIADNTGTYEATDYVLYIDNDEFIKEGDKTNE